MTLNLTNFFGLLGGLLVLAFAANRLSRWTRVPDVLVLIATGILLGPVLHWANPAQFGEVTRVFGTLALILILFAAGLELDLRRALKLFAAGTVLATLSYGLSFTGITYFCILALGMQKMPSMLAAATLACMSGSIVLPVLDQLELRHDFKTTLVIETSFGDGLGALAVGVLLDLASGGGGKTHGLLASIMGEASESGGSIAGGLAMLFLFKFLLALAIAVGAGFLWTRLLPAISDKKFWQTLTFAGVLLIYSGTHALGGSELFAVMAFGATLANLPSTRNSAEEFGFEILAPNASHEIHSFHSELAFLVRSFFFVLLGAMIEFGGLGKVLLASVGVLGVCIVARFIAVECSRVVWRGTTPREREFAVLLIPRGLITAVLALEVIRAMPVELVFLTSLVFAVILFTNVLVFLAAVRAKALSAESPGATAAEGAP